MASELLTALAQGGPRDGVKLSAPATWDGRVRKPKHSRDPYKVPDPESSYLVLYYEGHYELATVDGVDVWVWQKSQVWNPAKRKWEWQ